MPKGQSIAFTLSSLLAAGLLLAPAAVASEQLVAYEIVDESSIPNSLTGKPGDPARGRAGPIPRGHPRRDRLRTPSRLLDHDAGRRHLAGRTGHR